MITVDKFFYTWSKKLTPKVTRLRPSNLKVYKEMRAHLSRFGYENIKPSELKESFSYYPDNHYINYFLSHNQIGHAEDRSVTFKTKEFMYIAVLPFEGLDCRREDKDTSLFDVAKEFFFDMFDNDTLKGFDKSLIL